MAGFWASPNAPPEWLLDKNFKWIPKGTFIRYLRCQVGLELALEQQIGPLLQGMRRKLIYCSIAKLSLATRVVIVNHVLLASMWSILSSWIFSKTNILKIQRLVRNFLWFGNAGDVAKANVAWETITLPNFKEDWVS
jgi:hypothetical protein